METLSEILKLTLYCSASALCIYLIIVLVRFKVFLQVLQIELIDLNKNLKPILENLNVVTDKLRLEEPLMRVGAMFGNIINRVASLFMRR